MGRSRTTAARSQSTDGPPLIHVIWGTKAEAIKVTPVLREMDRRGVPYRLIETGQHGAYLPGLREHLDIREPDVCLGDGSDADTLPAAARWALGLARSLTSRKNLRSRVFGDLSLIHI